MAENEQQPCTKFRAFNSLGKLVNVRCGLWSCPYCARKNSIKWAIRVKKHMEKHPEQAYFWTLTLPKWYKSPEKAYKDLRRLWDTFRKALQRQYKDQQWAYVAFVEAHPKRSKIPHFHIISMLPIPEKYKWRKNEKTGKRWRYKMRLKDFAYRAGFGFIAYDKPVTTARAGWYVAKYASKTDEKMPKGFRRVRAARAWDKLPKRDGPTLIVKARGETNYHYCLRVQEITGIAVDELYELWTDIDVT